jgi:tRNA-(ms[2]io[6]A)-hydroxylase
MSGTYEQVFAELPLLSKSPDGWAELAAGELVAFLADHAVCEQQAALFALSLVGHYPEDRELVDKMSALAAEESVHLRRVAAALARRDAHPDRRRANPWVGRLRGHMETDREPWLKIDRLLVGALIEARSCERFTRLLEVLRERGEEAEADVVRLLEDLGPAEARHWRMFHALASRDADSEGADGGIGPRLDPGALAVRWQRWLEFERVATAHGGQRPSVHG